MAKANAGKSTKEDKKPGTSVVNIRESLAAEANQLADRIQAPGGDKIKLTKDKKFKLPDGTVQEGPLTVVILDFVSVNEFYDRPYKEGDYSPPACYAIGTEVNDKLTPSAKSPDKQAATCKECPNNEWGSKNDGKACSNKRRLAVISPDANPDSPMYILEVSPTSVKAFDSYVSTVRTQFGMPPIGVVTDVFFDPSVDYQNLRFGNPQSNPNLEDHFARKQAAKDRLAAEPDVSKYEKPAKKGRK